MATRKAETETQGGSAPKTRAKSVVVKLEAQSKVASSDKMYEVDVVHQNLSGGDVTLKPHTEVDMISAANKIPPMLVPKVVEGDVQDDEDDEKIQRMSAQMDLDEAKLKQIEVNPEEILKKVDLSGAAD